MQIIISLPEVCVKLILMCFIEFIDMITNKNVNNLV